MPLSNENHLPEAPNVSAPNQAASSHPILPEPMPSVTNPPAAIAPSAPKEAQPAPGAPAPPSPEFKIFFNPRFQPGNCANPYGRPKRTQEQKDALEAVRALAPTAAKKLQDLLESPRTSPTVKVRIIELILERTYGKPESSLHITSVHHSVEESREYILALVQKVREGMKDE